VNHGTNPRQRSSLDVASAKPAPADELRATRWWIVFGIAGWSAIALITAVDGAFQSMAQSGPPVASLRQLVSPFAFVLPGALLSVVVFLLFRRWARPERGIRANALLYTLTGLGFWVSWAGLDAAWNVVSISAGSSAAQPFLGFMTHALAGLAFNGLVLYAALPLLYHAAWYMGDVRRQEIRTARLQAELSRARTVALAVQLNPHFLFNTLHLASGLMNRDVRAAKHVLSSLGDLLRGSLAQDSLQMVELADELRLVERYTEIQKARFGDRLEVEYEIDEDTRSVLVPQLLLQPLVENAVVHGIANSEAGGMIRIQATQVQRTLILSVLDTGPEIEPAGPFREGIGIGGVRARLALIFGERASVHLAPQSGGGFRTEVRLPSFVERTSASPERGEVTPRTTGSGTLNVRSGSIVGLGSRTGS
jgi:two-component system, LytTR family, sensor kinase